MIKDTNKTNLILIIAVSSLIIYLYGFVPIYPKENSLTLISWMTSSWNPETNYEHGWIVFPAVIFFLYSERNNIKLAELRPSNLGLVILGFGVLLYLAAMRASQPRLAFFGLPFILLGMMYFLQGRARAKYILFAVFFIYFAIPMPGLQQATNGLQLIVSKACFTMGNLLGYEIIRVGNTIKSATGSWAGFNIAEGCSGIRSMMALIMITAIYGQYTQKNLWKKMIIFLSAFPLAIFGNFLRIFTIIVLAEFGYAEFAANLYHDWAGMLIFFPVSLLGVFTLDRLINLKKRKTIRRRKVS